MVARVLGSLLVLLSLSLALPDRMHAVGATPAIQTTRVLIELKGVPVARVPQLRHTRPSVLRPVLDLRSVQSRAYQQALRLYQDREIGFARARGIALAPLYRFQVLLNGFSALVPDNQVSALWSLPNVASVTLLHQVRPQLDEAVKLVHAPEAWTALGGGPNAGRGLKIAMIDTGIDISNPCFSDAGFAPPPGGRQSDTPANMALTNNKVIVARAFGSDPTKQYTAADSVGHGTATASVAGCDFGTKTPTGAVISGVAPAAYLMAYNISPEGLPCAGNDQQVAAFEAAVKDGAQVINFSFGGAAGDPAYEKAMVDAVHAAVTAGVTVVSSAGNAGPEAQSIGAPASYPDAIAVGATSNAHLLLLAVNVNGPGTVPADLHIEAYPGQGPFQGKIGPAQLVLAGEGRKPGDDTAAPTANDFSGKDLHGKIAVIQRGAITFETKIDNAEAAGAIGVIVYNNTGHTALVPMNTGAATLPAVSITQDDGTRLANWINAHPDATATIDPQPQFFPATPNLLTDFSSQGFGSTVDIKPDLVAPGQSMYMATQSTDKNALIYDPSGFTVADGTSFSSPMVAGAAALFLQSHPGASPGEVKAALMDTADMTAVQLGAPGSLPPVPQPGVVPSVEQEGAGLLNVQAMNASAAYLSPSSLGYGEINVAGGAVQQDLTTTLRDLNGGAGTWKISVQTPESGAGVAFTAPASVDLAAGSSAQVALHLSADSTAKPGNYDGFLVLAGPKATLHVPFLVHVTNLAVQQGSVLLVDDTVSRLPVTTQPKDVSSYFTIALTAIGKRYTLWREAEQGPPSLADLKRASAVIYFTGGNLNDFGPTNGNTEATSSPLSPPEQAALHQYLSQGGSVFLTGMGVPTTGFSTDWLRNLFGVQVATKQGTPLSFSLYDNTKNDQTATGGLSPPRPSAIPVGPAKNAGVFVGLKPVDFSTRGNGAGDNVAVPSFVAANLACPVPGQAPHAPMLLGVMGMKVVGPAKTGTDTLHGQAALQTRATKLADGPPNVGVVASDEPSFTHKPTYTGRTVLFSFGFEGINNRAGDATRAQVLARIFQWFADHPTVTVVAGSVTAGTATKLSARLHAPSKVSIAREQWQIGSTVLPATAGATTYTFPKAGRYRVRVLVMDSLGHRAVSAAKTIVVH